MRPGFLKLLLYGKSVCVFAPRPYMALAINITNGCGLSNKERYALLLKNKVIYFAVKVI